MFVLKISSEAEYLPPPLSVKDATFTPLVIDESEVAIEVGPETYEQGGLPK